MCDLLRVCYRVCDGNASLCVCDGFWLLYTCILRVSVRLSIHVVYVSPLPRYLGVFVTFLPIEAASLWAE